MDGAVNGSDRQAGEDVQAPARRRPVPRRIAPWRTLELCRSLATGEKTHADLAREYGVSRAAVTQFAKRHAREIDEIKANLDDEFAGLWIARKSERLAMYQQDLELIAGHPHHEWVKSRTAILKAVAEELGQLPGRAGVTVVPVLHVIEGVNIQEDLT